MKVDVLKRQGRSAQKRIIFSFLCLLFFSMNSLAFDGANPVGGPLTGLSLGETQPQPDARWEGSQLQLGASSSSYLLKDPAAISDLTSQNTVFNSVYGHWQAKTSGANFFYADISGFFTVNQASHSFINLKEAYWQTQAFSDASISLGRKKESWSSSDEFWKLGLWQPRFKWDFLATETAGLTGAFLNTELGGVRVTAFASPLSIPEIGAPFELDGGRFTSQSPWFWSPPQSITVFGSETSIYYDLDFPAISDLILKPNAAFKLEVGGPTGVWSRVGYSYKPLAFPLLSYEGFLNLSQGVRADVTLHPRVVYHHLGTVETGYQADQDFPISVTGSFSAEFPVRDDVPSSWTTQEIDNTYFASFLASYQIPARYQNLSKRNTTLSAGYLRRWGKDLPDRGPLVFSDQSLFEPRYVFTESVSLGASTPLPFRLLSKFSLGTRMIYDFPSEGTLLSGTLTYSAGRAWLVGVGADFVGVSQNSNSTSGSLSTEFLKRFQENDRVYGGVSYVF